MGRYFHVTFVRVFIREILLIYIIKIADDISPKRKFNRNSVWPKYNPRRLIRAIFQKFFNKGSSVPKEFPDSTTICPSRCHQIRSPEEYFLIAQSYAIFVKRSL